MKAVVSIYHDTRHQKRDKTYPVKIRVYDGKLTKLYPTTVSLTEAAFTKAMSKKPGELLVEKNTMEEKRLKASGIVEKMSVFSFKEFENKFERDYNLLVDVFSYYNQTAKELRENGQIKYSTVYLHASDSFRRFLQHKVLKPNPTRTTEELRADKSILLPFADITDKWLNRYQRWMLESGNSVTTISMYLRTLRSVFNAAIREKDAALELYPFGKDGFKIPAGKTRKHILDKEQLKKVLHSLWKFKTNDELITKARDFWFFIYNAYGMNVADIVRLQDTNILGQTIFFVRKKTKTKTKEETIIEVPVTEHMQYVINKYGQTDKGYIFDILKNCKNEEEKVAATDSFTTFINDHMERLCKQTGITMNCTTYTARHLFGTMAIRSGAPTALVQKAYGHASILTTENYIGDFDSDAKIDLSNKLMRF